MDSTVQLVYLFIQISVPHAFALFSFLSWVLLFNTAVHTYTEHTLKS